MSNEEFYKNLDKICNEIKIKKSPYYNMSDKVYTLRALDINKIYGTNFDGSQLATLKAIMVKNLYLKRCEK